MLADACYDDRGTVPLLGQTIYDKAPKLLQLITTVHTVPAIP